jgi:hypothetical protein
MRRLVSTDTRSCPGPSARKRVEETLESVVGCALACPAAGDPFNERLTMSSFSRFFDMASKALDKAVPATDRGTGSSQNGDWRTMLRGAADAVRPDSRPSTSPPAAPGSAAPPAGVSQQDRAAIARYDYLMQTADPHRVEQIHREAFERLTPQQRASVQARMQADLPAHERPASASPFDLARAAGRAEAARPGRMRSLLAGGGAAVGAGMVGAGAVGLLGAVAGGAILSTAATSLLAEAATLGVDFDAIAGNLDVSELTGAAEGVLGGAGEHIFGLGDQVSGWGDQISAIPGLGDLFGR